MSSTATASTSQDQELIEGIFERIASDLGMIIDREIKFSGVKAEVVQFFLQNRRTQLPMRLPPPFGRPLINVGQRRMVPEIKPADIKVRHRADGPHRLVCDMEADLGEYSRSGR